MDLPPFQALLETHRADLYRFLVASVGAGDADDCFQETVIAALRAYPKVRRQDNLRGWLLRIAQHKAIDSHRARGRRPLPVESPPERGGGEEPATGNSEPELWAAVRRLAPKQRAAVFCRSVMGMSYGELAGLLECSEDAARRNVHEGLTKLREEWSR